MHACMYTLVVTARYIYIQIVYTYYPRPGAETYDYRQDALMSICQDLRVQQINNDFTIRVREIMAAYAMEHRCK